MRFATARSSAPVRAAHDLLLHLPDHGEDLLAGFDESGLGLDRAGVAFDTLLGERKLILLVYPAGAAVTWASGSPPVATVNASGLVTAMGNGTATITATSGSVSGNATVTVAQEASTVVLTPAADTLAEGDTLRLSAEARDANGNAVADAGFGWSSSDTTVMFVDSAGLVTAAAPGTATVTAASGDALGTAELTVFEADRIALGAFYRATGGPNWKNSDNWLTDAPLGDWYGVQTDSAGRVVTLELVGELTGQGWISHGLRGSIPPELWRFL